VVVGIFWTSPYQVISEKTPELLDFEKEFEQLEAATKVRRNPTPPPTLSQKMLSSLRSMCAKAAFVCLPVIMTDPIEVSS
jgi:hypothetical protein